MSNKTFFGPGPSQLYPTVGTALEQALVEDVCTISHRSQAFKNIYAEAVANFRKLVNIPDNFQIVFTGSATEIWERIIKNCVENKSFHFTNGSFSKKFYQYSVDSGKQASQLNVPFGKGFNVNDANIDNDTEVICFTQNETSSGVSVPLEDIYSIREKHPNALIAVDVVSSLPHPNFDYSKIDTAFFSVQKCFGMPAGLGVWLVNERCIAKAEEMASKGILIGPHQVLPELAKMAKNNQTPSTPNVLGIYTFAKVVEDMLKKGVETIRQETSQKAADLYACIEANDYLSIAIENPAHRSETVIVANTDVSLADWNNYLAEFDLVISAGYGKFKETQIRIANFPAISTEIMAKLIGALNNYKK